MPQSNSTPERALIYTRVSDDKQSGASSQLTNARHLARVHALDVEAEIEDDGLTDVLDRPGLTDVLDRLERAHRGKRPIAWIVVDQADRLSRADSLETSELLLKMRRLGVRKVATPARIFDLFDPLDRTLLQIEADHKNNPYLKDLGRRSLDGMLDATRGGFWTGGKAPLGYVVVREPGDHDRGDGRRRRRKSGRLAVDPDTAPIVRELFERYRDGASTRELARWLSARTGQHWTHHGVYMILRRDLYTGTRVFGRRAEGKHARVLDGQAVILPEGQDPQGDVIRLSGWPQIVEPELFAAAQRRLATGKSNGRHQGVPPAPLAGLCRCGLCGAPMQSRRQSVYPYLRCRRADEDPATCPGSVLARGDVVLRRVLALLAEDLLQGDTVARLVELAGEAEDEAKAAWERDEAAAERALAECSARLATARRRMSDAAEDLREDYEQAVRALKEERAALEADLARLRTEQPSPDGGDAALLTRWLELCRSTCEQGTTAEPAELNALLRELVDHISVSPPERPRKGDTVGRIEVVLPEWLSRVLSTVAARRCA